MPLGDVRISPITPVKPGWLSSPIAQFTGKSDDPRKNMFTGVPDPTGSGRVIVLNTSEPGVGDGHATQTTGRTLELGDETYAAFMVLYMKAADLPQSGRNLFFQTQMKGSPINAISTTSGKSLDFVWRNPTTMHRDPLGPIPWGRWMYFVVGQKLAKAGGFVKCWYEIDRWPDVTQAPDHAHANINTWQGTTGHNTLGQYRSPSSGGVYRMYWDRFGRDMTPAGAIARAKAAA